MVHKKSYPKREKERGRERKREKRKSRKSGLETKTSATCAYPKPNPIEGGTKSKVAVRLPSLTEANSSRGPHDLTEVLKVLSAKY